jgi:beta-lactamase regulating signal transducer with metallopeptidase domain
MIAGWLFYCLAVSSSLVLAAAAIDSVLTARGKPARGVWIATLALSLIAPAAVYLRQRFAPPPTPPSGVNVAGNSISDRFPSRVIDAPRAPLDPIRQVVAHRPRAPEFIGTERLVVGIAIACILLAALRVAFDSLLLYRSRRGWRPDVIDGVDVLVSDDLGPAIVGILQPAIVLPRWMLALEPADRALMLTHEREHVRASDGRVTTAALIAVVCMPWNPLMLYSLRRLRTAIEVDCDRRVLSAFPDVRRYGHLLVDVAQRAAGSSLAIAGFSERAAPVARRIWAMTVSHERRNLVRDLAMATVSIVAIGASMAFLPPEAPARFAVVGRSPISAKYVGDSIARGDTPPIIVSAATDLPISFSASKGAQHGPSTNSVCPRQLRDDRDGTLLNVSISHTSVAGVVQRGDTTWTRVQSIGYYFPVDDGRYGVSTKRDETLRVGCGGLTRLMVGDRVIMRTSVVSTLDMSDDDRARRIGNEVTALIHVEPLAVDLYAGRLDVVVGDTAAIGPNTEAPWNFVHAIFDRSRVLLGRAAMPETLAVSVRRSKDRWVTMYYYSSMAK